MFFVICAAISRSQICMAKLKCSSFCGDKQLLHIDTLQRKQLDLFFNPTGVACQAASGAHYPVTGDDNRDRVMAHRAAYSLG